MRAMRLLILAAFAVTSIVALNAGGASEQRPARRGSDMPNGSHTSAPSAPSGSGSHGSHASGSYSGSKPLPSGSKALPSGSKPSGKPSGSGGKSSASKKAQMKRMLE